MRHLTTLPPSLPPLQFLPQDKVVEFARMTPKDLLEATEKVRHAALWSRRGAAPCWRSSLRSSALCPLPHRWLLTSPSSIPERWALNALSPERSTPACSAPMQAIGNGELYEQHSQLIKVRRELAGHDQVGGWQREMGPPLPRQPVQAPPASLQCICPA